METTKNTKEYEMKYVTVGCNAHPAYAFYLPIINKIWANFGFTLMPLLTGSWTDNWAKYVISQLSNVKYIEAGGWDTGRVAQVARLFAFENLEYQDQLMTSDVDMIPLSKIWFNQSLNDKLNLYFSNAYNHTKYAMCYIEASKEIWGQIINEPFDKVMGRANHWGFDEEYMGTKIHAWEGDRSNCNYIQRTHRPGAPCPDGRIDRSCWTNSLRFKDRWINSLIDCHGFRPCYDGEEWRLTKVLLRRLDIDYKYIVDYREQFIKLIDKERDYGRIR